MSSTRNTVGLSVNQKKWIYIAISFAAMIIIRSGSGIAVMDHGGNSIPLYRNPCNGTSVSIWSKFIC